jgi:serine/threonine protein kinase
VVIDIKPDNVGFSTDGVVKLFDFGLATCVKARAMDSDSYEMTGMTGSLRYMAPETALRKPYNEKVDVYSYGILVWQMARDRVPFKGLSKDEFLKNISVGGERPKLDSSWPSAFSNLLTRCWHEDVLQRPSFQSIVEELDRMIHGDIATVPVKKGPMRGASIKGADNASTSTWF